MRAQEQAVVSHQCVNEERNAPQAVLFVVNTNGEYRVVGLGRVAGAFESVEFRPFLYAASGKAGRLRATTTYTEAPPLCSRLADLFRLNELKAH
jgi:hypothetical protein